jgi:hypothetical protein
MMPKRLVILAALVFATCGDSGASTCTGDCTTVNDGGQMVHGSGNVKTETRAVAPFTAIRVDAAVNVLIERTGNESLTVTGDDNLLPLFTAEVANGTLSLSTADGKSFEGKTPTYRITVGDLSKIDINGSGTVHASKIEGEALSISISGSGTMHVAGQVSNLTASVSGSGTMDLAGQASDLTASVSGSGTVDAAELAAQHAKVVVTGSGDLIVNASDQLDARITGSGSIRYIGSPKLASAVNGSGSIKQK